MDTFSTTDLTLKARRTEKGRLEFNPRGGKKIEPQNYVSNCYKCRRGVFKNRHKYIWTNTGYLHKECVTDEDKIPSGALYNS